MAFDSRAAVIERRPDHQPRQQKLDAQPQRRWEYRSREMERTADIAQFGAEGWECFAVLGTSVDMAMFYFRRPM